MKKRRAFLASAAAVAGGGCLGQITADPVFVLGAETVGRTESALVPEVSVIDEEATEASPATIDITAHNRSFRTIEAVGRDPEEGGGSRSLFAHPISQDGRMGLTEPGNATRSDGWSCWAAQGAIDARGILAGPIGVPPLLHAGITFAVGVSGGAGCLEPGSYRFEQRYRNDGAADVNWAFELILSEPGL